MSNAFATVAVFQDLTTAEFYQSWLEENGLDAFIPDQYVCATKDPALMIAVGNIRLQVPADQAEEAIEMLRNSAEDMAGLSLAPEQLVQTPALPPVASEWKKTWLAIGAMSIFGLTFTILLPWGTGVHHHLPGTSSAASGIFYAGRFALAFVVGLASFVYAVRVLLKKGGNDLPPGPAQVTENDYVPGPEGEPGVAESIWSKTFAAPRAVVALLLFSFLAMLLYRIVAAYGWRLR